MSTLDKKEEVKALVEPLMTEDMFLVNIKVKPINNYKVFIDADNGMSIERCIKINRALYKLIEAEGWFPDGDFSLEISSPGVDEPLLLDRQFQKNLGRNVEITMLDGSKLEGELKVSDETTISIVETKGKGKKQEIIEHNIAKEQIKQTVVQIKF